MAIAGRMDRMMRVLAIVLVAGLYLPGPVVAWFQHIADMLG